MPRRLLAASLLATTALAGCSGSQLDDAPPPPSAYIDAPAAPDRGARDTTELLGGPTPPPWRPVRPAPEARDYATMAPIPNPEDMSEADRVRVYGPDRAASASRHDRHVRRVERADHAAPTHGSEARPARRHISPTVQAPTAHSRTAAPTPAPAARPAPAAPSPAPHAAKPAAPVIAPAPVKTTPPVTATPAPLVKTPEPAKAAAPQTKAEKLGAGIVGDAAAGSKLDIPASLAAGEEGVVVLTLPQTLLGAIQAGASKLGLTVASRIVDARATLTGEGYVIVPDASQTARLKEGEATSFNWQVTPLPGKKGPLKAEVAGDLKGADAPVSFPITAVEQPAASVPSAPADAAGAPSTITIPPFGQVRTGVVALVGLLILALIILSAFLRAAAERKRERARRRRATRAMSDLVEEREVAAQPVALEAAPANERVVIEETPNPPARSDAEPVKP